MIIQENIDIRGMQFVHSYSDSNMMLCQVSSGDLYGDVYDLAEFPQEYEETDIPIEQSNGE